MVTKKVVCYIVVVCPPNGVVTYSYNEHDYSWGNVIRKSVVASENV